MPDGGEPSGGSSQHVPVITNPVPVEEAWELFDLIKDPREMNNVYHNRAYGEVVIGLKNELARLRQELDVRDGIVVL